MFHLIEIDCIIKTFFSFCLKLKRYASVGLLLECGKPFKEKIEI